MEKCQNGSSSRACKAAASVDLPTLDGPLSRMIFAGIGVNGALRGLTGPMALAQQHDACGP